MSSIFQTISHIVTAKCPACRKGEMFQYPAYRVDKLTMVNHRCPVCAQDFRQEPGFYFGAMYVSYALNIAIMVTCGVAYEVLFDPDENWKIMLSVFIPAIVLIPLTFRISRSIYLYTFGKIDKQTK